MSIITGPKIPNMVSGALGDLYLTQGNALLRMLQALVQPNVISVNLNTPPGSPTNGDTYTVGSSATGLWVGQENSIAYWSMDNPNVPAGEWEFYSPLAGWAVGNQTDGLIYTFNGSGWGALGTIGESVQTITTSTTLGFAGGFNTLVQATAGTGITLTLPTAIGVGGRIIRIIMVDTGVGGITINTTAGQTINGYTSFSITNQFQSFSLESTNANWLIVAVAI